MGLDKLIELGAAIAVLAASTGQLPRAILAIHLAQLHIIRGSQASKWPKAELLSYRRDQRSKKVNGLNDFSTDE
jgi:hypothetical protein